MSSDRRFRIQITSAPDYEELVAEVWRGEELVVELLAALRAGVHGGTLNAQRVVLAGTPRFVITRQFDRRSRTMRLDLVEHDLGGGPVFLVSCSEHSEDRQSTDTRRLLDADQVRSCFRMWILDDREMADLPGSI